MPILTHGQNFAHFNENVKFHMTKLDWFFVAFLLMTIFEYQYVRKILPCYRYFMASKLKLNI